MNTLQRWMRARSLSSQDSHARVRAIEKLSAVEDPEAIDLLLDALGDSEAGVRSAAASALGQVANADVVGHLVSALLREREMMVQQKIADALRKIDDPSSTDLLLANLDSLDARARQAAASALRKVEWHRLDNGQKARVAVVCCDWEEVVMLGGAAVESVAQALASGTTRVKAEAADALARIGIPEAVEALMQVMNHPDSDRESREIPARALRRIIADDLPDAQQVRIGIALQEWSDLVSLGPAAVEPLAEVLREGPCDAREQAATALGKIASTEAIDALASALEDSKQTIDVRRIAMRVVSVRRDKRAVEALACALRDEVWEIRESAAKALVGMGWSPPDDTHRALLAIARGDWVAVEQIGAAAIEPLVSVLAYTAVSPQAVRLLIRLRPAGIDALVHVVKDPEQPAVVREVAAAALAGAGDTRAVESLKVMLNDSDVAVRYAAIWALERLDWKPADDNQRIMVAIAHDDWGSVHRLGVAAAGPLLDLAASSMAPLETVRALEAILAESPGSMSINRLRKLTSLQDFTPHAPTLWNDKRDDRNTRKCPPSVANCGKVRKLARSELIRRGIMI